MSSSEQKSSQNLWFGVSLGLIGIIIGYTAATFNGTPKGAGGTVPTPTPSNGQQAPAAAVQVPAVNASADHLIGNGNARVTLVTYSDFDCPYSKRHHPTMTQLHEAYGDKVDIVYRHFPLSMHPTAQKKAEAAECVTELGGKDKFWEYADALYDPANQTGITLDELAPLAVQIGIPEQQFRSCLDSGKYTKKVQDEEAAGAAGGINGTPGNVIIDNKTKTQVALSGAQPLENFKTAIDAILAK